MLTNLSINNYALIESLSVNFKDKLTTITGETGAGKSILLGALGLVLGKRADLTTLKNKEKKCVVEAQFSIREYNLKRFFEENDLDYENDTIIRREILPSGKSRAFVNDTPTTLQQLQMLSEKLIDIHSQHQTLSLTDTTFQLHILDTLANNSKILTEYAESLKKYKYLQKEIQIIREKAEIQLQQYEYNKHLFTELEKANIKEGEQEEVEQRLEEMNNIESIKLNLAEAQSISENEETGLYDLLTKITSNFSKIASYSKTYNDIFTRLQSIKIEFEDIVNEINTINENITFDDSEMNRLNDRLQLIFDLHKKHNTGSVEELSEIQENLSVRIGEVDNASEIIKEKEESLQLINKKVENLAQQLSKKRKEVIPLLVETLENRLAKLGMENTRFKFVFSQANEYYESGKDNLELLISANKGQNFGELKKVASGGELSRIMLVVKTILSSKLKLPTIIFDEIDTGVSGDVSNKMADIMGEMSENMQIITITHLPQIAAKGNYHFRVYKTNNESIETQLKELSFEERVVEIAEMLGGKNLTKTAVEHAKQLLN